MLVRVSDLRAREVVNVVDGRRLGPICDMEIDLSTGQVTSIMVPGPSKIMGILGRYNDYVIPWSRIKRIGMDVILVEANDTQSLSSDVFFLPGYFRQFSIVFRVFIQVI